MKPTRILLAIATLFAMAPLQPIVAHEAAKSGEAKVERKAGPNGGRVITKVEPRVEFLVMPDRKVKLTFLDEAGNPVALSGQTATLTGGDRMNPTRLTFAKDGESLVSAQPLPAGDNVPVVLQIKPTPDAPGVIEKFGVNLAKCPECHHAEYACTCGH